MTSLPLELVMKIFEYSNNSTRLKLRRVFRWCTKQISFRYKRIPYMYDEEESFRSEHKTLLGCLIKAINMQKSSDIFKFGYSWRDKRNIWYIRDSIESEY